MFKWLAKILGLQKKEPHHTEEGVNNIAIKAFPRLDENQARDEARIRDMTRPNQGFTKPNRPSKPEPAKFNSRGVRVPTEEESRRARPVVPPPRPVARSANRYSNDVSPSRSPDNGSDTFLATAVALSVLDSSPSYSTPSGGYDSSCSSSSDSSGGGGTCD